MKLVNFKATPEEILRWKQEAHREQMTMSAWIRLRLNGPTAPALASLALGATKTVERAATPSSCPHRLPRGAWCKSCGKLKK